MAVRPSIVRVLVVVATAGPLALACRATTEPATSAVRVYRLDVAATPAACTGAFAQQCLLARERQDAPYTLFYETIGGFMYEPGYRYLVSVVSKVLTPT